ncbi:MAG: hypothetical protein K0S74_1629 [Chlamydiales bacterium]|jgi:hypothetical protein|nr:hypothetical protein [Chlamydiales bacterium]
MITLTDNNNYGGAGILPYCDYKGNRYLLLGQELHSTYWGSFIGERDKGEADPSVTAARECNEETLSVLGDQASWENKLNKTNRVANGVFKITNDTHRTVVYCVRINLQNGEDLETARNEFTTRRSQPNLPYFKKDKLAIRWVNIKKVQETLDLRIQGRYKRNNGTNAHEIIVGKNPPAPITLDGKFLRQISPAKSLVDKLNNLQNSQQCRGQDAF